MRHSATANNIGTITATGTTLVTVTASVPSGFTGTIAGNRHYYSTGITLPCTTSTTAVNCSLTSRYIPQGSRVHSREYVSTSVTEKRGKHAVPLADSAHRIVDLDHKNDVLVHGWLRRSITLTLTTESGGSRCCCCLSYVQVQLIRKRAIAERKLGMGWQASPTAPREEATA